MMKSDLIKPRPKLNAHMNPRHAVMIDVAIYARWGRGVDLGLFQTPITLAPVSLDHT